MKKGCILILVFCSAEPYAQDLHFSHYWENPGMVNPALCGSESRLRFSATVKDQWGQVTVPYRTFGVSGEMRFPASNWKQVDNFRTLTFKKQVMGRLAAGLSLYNDVSGDGNLGFTHMGATISSFIPLNRESYLSLGLKGGAVQYRLEMDKLRFPDQFQNSQFMGGVSGETFSGNQYIDPDLAGGLLYAYGENRHVVQVEHMLLARLGVSYQHLLSSNDGFLPENTLKRWDRYVFHGDFTFGIQGSDCALSPSFLVQTQGPLREIIGGAMLKHFLNEQSVYTGLVSRTYFGYGAYFRVGDALVIATSLCWKQQYSFLVSYDINLSQLSNASRFRGGLELTLKYSARAGYLYEKKEAPPKH